MRPLSVRLDRANKAFRVCIHLVDGVEVLGHVAVGLHEGVVPASRRGGGKPQKKRQYIAPRRVKNRMSTRACITQLSTADSSSKKKPQACRRQRKQQRSNDNKKLKKKQKKNMILTCTYRLRTGTHRNNGTSTSRHKKAKSDLEQKTKPTINPSPVRPVAFRLRGAIMGRRSRGFADGKHNIGGTKQQKKALTPPCTFPHPSRCCCATA